MSKFNFSVQDKEAIRSAIACRREAIAGKFEEKHLNSLSKIEIELNSDATNLSSSNRAILIGCLRECYVYPIREFLELSDYQLMFKGSDFRERAVQIDIALQLLNRIMDGSEERYRRFADSFVIIDGILNAKKIAYSITTNGKIYKAAIFINDIRGVAFELDWHLAPENFSLGILNASYYMKMAAPGEVKQQLEKYFSGHQPTVMQQAFYKILQQSC